MSNFIARGRSKILLLLLLSILFPITIKAGTYGVVFTIVDRVLSASGTEYLVSVEYGKDAEIPKGAELKVREIEKGTEEYKSYLAVAEEKISGKIVDAGFLDIEIEYNGSKIEPKAPVKVEIKRIDSSSLSPADLSSTSLSSTTPLKADEAVEDELTLTDEVVGTEPIHTENSVFEEAAVVVDPAVEDSLTVEESPTVDTVNILHFENDDNIKEIDVEDTGDVLTFEASSFSVYAIIYTVDFSYNGYEISIKGGSSILLSSLARILGMDGFSVADVESVRFSDDSLLSVSRVDAGTAVTGTVVVNGEEIRPAKKGE